MTSQSRVLIADDNLLYLRVLERLLRRVGCDRNSIDVATTGLEAVERARDTEYGLILLDCQMPGIDGPEAVRRIRRHSDSGRTVPIVGNTSEIGPDVCDTFIEAGANGCVAKIMTPDEMGRVWRMWMRA